jgi:hypothetical protein
MSQRDLFTKYSQLYQKGRAREIVPEGPFVRQLTDIPRQGLDIALFFKGKRVKNVRQIHIGVPVPSEVAGEEGFLETDDNTYLSRTLLSNFKTVDYLRAVISAGRRLEETRERVHFLKTCQRIVDVLLRKARNVVHLGDFEPFRFDRRVFTIEEYLKKKTKLDKVAIEAASISFHVAEPDYILMPSGEIIVFNDKYSVPQGVFYFAGGIGYTFDQTEGAASEERVFRSQEDLSMHGIDSAYLEGMMLSVTEDFQTRVHSIIYADVWKKVKARPIGVNFGERLLIKADPASEIWTGVFEVYLGPPKT